MNDENLKGYGFHERSAEEVRAMQAKGGRNSGKTRRRKADLRKAIQAALTSTYTDADGEKLTGEEMFVKSVMEALTEPDGKNWSKAIDVIVKLTGAEISEEQKRKDKAEIKLLQAKAMSTTNGGADVEDLTPLAELLRSNTDENVDD